MWSVNFWIEMIMRRLWNGIGKVLRAVFLKLPRLLLWGWFGLMCLEVVTTGKMWQKAAHTESLPYNSLTWATSDHEKEEKMWCKRWNGFWLIDERSQKKVGLWSTTQFIKTPLQLLKVELQHLFYTYTTKRATVNVKLGTKAMIFFASFMSRKEAHFHESTFMGQTAENYRFSSVANFN